MDVILHIHAAIKVKPCVGWNYLSIHKIQRLHRWSLEMDK